MTVEAYVFVSTTNPGPRAACQAIRKLQGIVQADALFGDPPVIAIIRAADLAQVDQCVDAIIGLPMVTDTETHIVRDISAA
jgi:Lrp/AsnC ligand binding domain